jgi:hypothetical protein
MNDSRGACAWCTHLKDWQSARSPLIRFRELQPQRFSMFQNTITGEASTPVTAARRA